MDTAAKPNVRRQDSGSFADIDDHQQRLAAIIAANAAIADENRLFKTYREQLEADLMRKPVTAEKSFAFFGLLLGLFPPAAIFFRMFQNNLEGGIVLLFIFINLVCAVVGYFSGKLIGRMVLQIESYSWKGMLFILPFVGMLWGIITGGIGGFFGFIIGAVFGAIIAAMVGSVAVPAFTVFHRLLKRGEMIEQKHLLPLSFGITLIISAFILGL